MNATQARAAYRKVGASRATGPALAAMYGQLVADMHGGKAALYVSHLLKLNTDEAVTARAKALLADRATAWDVLMGMG